MRYRNGITENNGIENIDLYRPFLYTTPGMAPVFKLILRAFSEFRYIALR